MRKRVNKKKSGVEAGSFFNLRGCFKGHLRDAQGRPLSYFKSDNTVATVGRREVLDLIITGGSTDLFGWMAVGTSTTAPATGDTHLGSEVDRNAIGTFDTTNLTSSTPNWDAVASWNTNEANTTLGEVGIFNSSGADSQTILAHATFSTIDKTTSNTLTITYTISN